MSIRIINYEASMCSPILRSFLRSGIGLSNSLMPAFVLADILESETLVAIFTAVRSRFKLRIKNCRSAHRLNMNSLSSCSLDLILLHCSMTVQIARLARRFDLSRITASFMSPYCCADYQRVKLIRSMNIQETHFDRAISDFTKMLSSYCRTLLYLKNETPPQI